MKTEQTEYDVLIAGAGSAGCILAARIAEHGRNPRNGSRLSVGMVEAGPYLGGGKNRPGYGDPVRRSRNSFLNYEMGSRYLWPYGMVKAVGGSVMHFGTYGLNDEVFAEEDYVAWQRETGVDWSSEDFREAIEETRVMRNLKPAPEQMMTRGNHLFANAVRDMGFKPERIMLARQNCLFCGRCGSGHFCKYDAKATSQPYIDRALELGVDIIADSQVDRVLIDPRAKRPAAIGLVTTREGEQKVLKAKKVIVSCGIVGTPMLFYRSGYGPGEKVQGTLYAENPNVGRNLETDMMAGSVVGLFDEAIKPPEGTSAGTWYVTRDWEELGQGKAVIQDHPMSGVTYPHEAALSELAPQFGRDHKNFMKTAITRIGGLYPFIEKPGVFGEVDLNGQVTTTTDQDRVEKVLSKADEITQLAVAIMEKMGATAVKGRPARYYGALITHAAGSCRAGSDRSNSVVNSDFESHDIDNLLVCDASVLPRQQQFGAMPTVAVAAFAWRRMVSRHFS